ncbi:30S ribosomal protein S2, partial [Candidatus Saccharibacteria bacterium]|nr:30S ribosomal protein S2 [Candidatus Saccharibacteria bacterium]
TAEQLLEAGVHFGHVRRRWHPKMAPYIYTEKDGVHIFDLFKTRARLEEACRFLQERSAREGILFVGTKKQAQEIVRREAERVGVYFLTERWVGGLLTNFKAVRKNIEKLEELSDKMKKGEFKHYTKKERLLIEREIRKLERDIGGLQGLRKLPKALVLASARNEAIAAKEGKKTGVPVVAIADTNANPLLVDYIIPANDDAAASIEIIIKTLADAVAKRKR